MGVNPVLLGLRAPFAPAHDANLRQIPVCINRHKRPPRVALARIGSTIFESSAEHGVCDGEAWAPGWIAARTRARLLRNHGDVCLEEHLRHLAAPLRRRAPTDDPRRGTLGVFLGVPFEPHRRIRARVEVLGESQHGDVVLELVTVVIGVTYDVCHLDCLAWVVNVVCANFQ